MSVLERRRRHDPRRAETERALLAAAEELLREGAAFAELNVSAIAERAGRARTAFYAHFEDRRQLLLRLIETAAEEAREAIAPFLTGTRRADVQRAVAGLLATFRRHDVALRAFTEAAGYDPEVNALWTALVMDFAEAARTRIEAAGRPTREAQATALALAWMTERTCSQHVLGAHDSTPDADIVGALTDAWWRAIAT